MTIAYIVNRNGRGTDPILTRTADRLAALGVAVAGMVQTNTDRDDGCRCDMDVRILPTGEVYRISQNRGPEARGCRLDPSQLEAGVALMERALGEGAEVLVLNKFGKHEAEGRGCCSTIGRAVGAGVPVLLAVGPLNLDAFLRFAGDFAEEIAPSSDALTRWALDRILDPTTSQTRAATGLSGHPAA